MKASFVKSDSNFCGTANNQMYGRRRASWDHCSVKSRCDEVLGEDFDYTSYPNFVDSIS